jgi:AraC family transcriptional regulator of adaptative response/methylated-DNA-[protein]-cysteine methyltransferase
MKNEYARIEGSLRFLQSRFADQPGLDEVASNAGLSPYHFQRLFRQWVGISPKRYLEFLTVNNAKRLLKSNSVLNTAHELGLSGPSRLHDQFISIEAITPGEYKQEWQGVEIRYGFTPGPFGEMLIAQTERGVCLLAFVDRRMKTRELDRLQRLYQRAKLKEDTVAVTNTAMAIFGLLSPPDGKFHLYVRGTNFQVNIWRALLQLPDGSITSYRQLAQSVGRPEAIRAAANAVAANPINYLIPCHRVLRSDGTLGGFRGGEPLKEKLLQWELADLGSVKAAVNGKRRT